MLIGEKADWAFLLVEGLIALWAAGEDKADAVTPAINANHGLVGDSFLLPALPRAKRRRRVSPASGGFKLWIGVDAG